MFDFRHDILHAMNTLADKFHANHSSNANQQGDKGNGIDKLCWTTVQFNTMRMISFLRHRKTLWTIFQYDACVGQDLSLKYDSEKVSCLKATRFQIQVRHLEIKGKTNKRFMVAWLSFAFPLLIFILGLAFNYNYIIVLLKSYDAAYKKGVKEIPVWKKTGMLSKSFTSLCADPLPSGSWGEGGGVCTHRNQSANDSDPKRRRFSNTVRRYLVSASRVLLRTTLSSLISKNIVRFSA